MQFACILIREHRKLREEHRLTWHRMIMEDAFALADEFMRNRRQSQSSSDSESSSPS